MNLYSVRKKLNMGIPLTSIKLRVTDYARVSTEHIEQKKSLQNQVEHFEQYIKENINWTYVKGYVDNGISGTSDIKRDNFMKMIEDAKMGKFDLIVTKEISRFSRNTLDSIKYTRLLLSYGVAVLFVNDNINTALPDSELRLTIMASMAQDEIRRLSERVKFGMNRAIERGEILGNNMMYGYRKNKETGSLNIIEDEAKIVRKIYDLYAIEGLSISKICKVLNNMNLKTNRGKKWCVSTISRMIENPKYKGYYCAKKSEIVDYMTKKVKYLKKNEWITYNDKEKIPSIVDEDLWERANIRLNARKKSFSNRKKEKTIYKNRYLYSSKIYCGNHNVIFNRRNFRKSNKDVTWVCSEYLKNGKKTCDSPNIRESELDIIFKDIVSKLEINLLEVVAILNEFYKKQQIIEEIDIQIKIKEQERDKIILKKEKLLDLSMDGCLSNKEFYEKNTAFNNSLNKINEKLDRLIIKKQNIKENNDNYNQLIECIELKLNSKLVFNKIVSCLLKRIVVYKICNDKNNMKLDIFLYYENDELGKNYLLFKSNYEFKRGYDTNRTKRYSVNYLVNCYLC